MANGECQLNNLGELRNYVYENLCSREKLVPGAFHMSEQILIRQGRPCGIHFCLHGPRAVMFSAIWDSRHNSILFYDSTGERFQKTQLIPALEFEVAAA